MTRIIQRGLTALICCLLFLAGCGSSAKKSGTVASADALKGPAIRLMVMYNSVGVDANPEIVQGAIAAAKAINARGGVHGLPIQIEGCDNHNDANQAAACANKAVSEGVIATVGNISQQSTAYLPILAQHQIASLGQSPANPSDFTSPDSFPISGGAVANFAGLGRLVADAGAKHIVVVRPDIAAGAAAKLFVTQALKPLGLSVTNDVAVPPSAPDMATYVASALSGHTDGLVIALAGNQAINFIQGAQQADPKIKIGFVSSSLSEVVKALGPSAQGLMQADFLEPASVTTPGTREYVSEMKAAGYKDVSGERNLPWLSVHLFAELASSLPGVTAPGVFAALPQASPLQSPLGPPVSFSHGGVAGIPRLFTACVFGTVLNSNGEETPISGHFFDPFKNTTCPTA